MSDKLEPIPFHRVRKRALERTVEDAADSGIHFTRNKLRLGIHVGRKEARRKPESE